MSRGATRRTWRDRLWGTTRRKVATVASAVGGLFVLSLLIAAGRGWPTMLAVLVVVAVSIAFYWLPTWVAYHRHHPRRVQVAVINLLAGWTFIGWVVAVVIAAGPEPNTPRHAAEPE